MWTGVKKAADFFDGWQNRFFPLRSYGMFLDEADGGILTPRPDVGCYLVGVFVRTCGI